MPYMTRIPSDLARFGLNVELVPGWESRGSSSFAPAAVTCHWTAGPKNAADKARPSLNVVVNGRPGIPGPLANIYLARDGTCVVIASGRANHAGVGGFRGLVGNSAVYGIEAESGGDGDWTKTQRKVYPRLVAALLSGIGRDASWAHGHHEWAPDRKIDIRDIMPTVRAEAAAILANPSYQEDDMSDYNRAEVVGALHEILGIARALHPAVAAIHVGVMDPNTGTRAVALQIAGRDPVEVDEEALAAAMAPRLGELLKPGSPAVGAISDTDIERLAKSFADEYARRVAD